MVIGDWVLENRFSPTWPPRKPWTCTCEDEKPESTGHSKNDQNCMPLKSSKHEGNMNIWYRGGSKGNAKEGLVLLQLSYTQTLLLAQWGRMAVPRKFTSVLLICCRSCVPRACYDMTFGARHMHIQSIGLVRTAEKQDLQTVRPPDCTSFAFPSSWECCLCRQY